MQFFNNTTLEDIVDRDIDVFLKSSGSMISSLPMCKTFLLENELWIDCVPPLNRKYTAIIPQTAIISRNEQSLDTGRFAVFVDQTTQLGQLVASLMVARQFYDENKRRQV